jgi:uncharacterized protein (TIGR02118 family)
VIKRISIVHKRTDLKTAQFVKHWLGPHAKLARQVPGLRGYVVYVADDPDQAGCDGVAITWFDSREAAEAGFASEPIRSALAVDRQLFLKEVRVFFAEEHVVLTPPQPNRSH